MREVRSAWRTLTGEPEGVILHGRYRRKWEYNIKTDRRLCSSGLDSSDSVGVHANKMMNLLITR
jgi:hypothetical protein